ncbi:MAG: Protein of unknown function (DUF1501) [uncultured Nocardioidaceae bacterium]|uniref:DUF1501 domain-containing protein n=1 Tax=uncultured Nocardioidaceae bacterium TaxID=253824 RepID=A0A6J4LGT1_9ACTN|nr:MAG: Protein of unknown function (DUF1501) [uncultured Nocardioidaceae bacterium]
MTQTQTVTPAVATTESCGCPDFALSRRRLLGGLTGAAGAGLMTSVLGDVYRQVAFGAEGDRNVLVVLSLRGGADGLSMVVPHGEPALAAARPRISIPTNALLASDDMFGLHPGFEPLLPMWRAGTFGAVHAVGLPQPNRSHFTAMEEVEDADPGAPERRGWINRLVGLEAGTAPVQAVELGSPMLPTSMYGPEPVLGLKSLKDLALAGDDPLTRSRRRSALHKAWDTAPGALGQGVRSALSTSESLEHLASPRDPLNGASYPVGDLGDSLAETARLIRADVGARIVTIDYGSWDMHTQLGTLEWGSMQTMVTELAGGLKAFFQDLDALGSRVTVVTISEFGRRVAANGAGGLDHGYGNCMLLLGAGVNGGQVHGVWPGLAKEDLNDGDLRVTRDYRSVLAEVTRARFPELDSTKIFPDFTMERIGAMRGF